MGFSQYLAEIVTTGAMWLYVYKVTDSYVEKTSRENHVPFESKGPYVELLLEMASSMREVRFKMVDWMQVLEPIVVRIIGNIGFSKGQLLKAWLWGRHRSVNVIVKENDEKMFVRIMPWMDGT